MRKFLYATAALALIAASAAHADERGRTTAGAMVGGATGAATGAVIGGPVGAAVGGVVGAAIGAGSVPHHVRTYIVEHPVESVRIQGRIERGSELPDSVVIHEIPQDPDYGYVYVDQRPVVVKMDSRKVVYEGDVRAVDSDATAAVRVAQPPDEVITYVEKHHVRPVRVEERVRVGTVLPDTIDLTPVPDDPDYGYVYVDQRPVVVRMRNREVVYEGDVRAVDSDTTAAVPVTQPPDDVITYVERHHVRPVTVEEGVRVGTVLPGTVELTPVPDDPDYAYVYTDEGPVLVRKQTRKVIWVH
ncbi:MAG TPA: DUF1236 domain-containing protein [Rhizobiaceae bacterium]|nr:DUF1236 domain-containing protein [Rhizobiaceae bacterium]